MLSDTNLENKDLLTFLREYERLANQRDFNALIPFIDENALYWFSNGSYRGIDAIRRAFEQTWKNIKDERYTISEVSWLFANDYEAVCTYFFHSDGIVNGQRQEYSGRGTNIFQKKDGKWKITHEHLSKIV
jgi:ketosteroid isomerase-like protein